jgi:hypothetical protein
MMGSHGYGGGHHAGAVTGLGINPSTSMMMPTSSVTTQHHHPHQPQQHAPTWHQPQYQAPYNPDLAAANRGWDVNSYFGTAPATGLPGTNQSYPYQQRVPSLTGPALMASEARFVSIHDYDGSSQPTATS